MHFPAFSSPSDFLSVCVDIPIYAGYQNVFFLSSFRDFLFFAKTCQNWHKMKEEQIKNLWKLFYTAENYLKKIIKIFLKFIQSIKILKKLQFFFCIFKFQFWSIADVNLMFDATHSHRVFFFSLLPAMYVRLWCDVKHWRARANYETPSKRGGAMKNNKSNNQHISLCFTMLKLCLLDIFFLFRPC